MKRYDASGTENNITFTHSGNRLSEWQNTQYGYDNNGNMTQDARTGLEIGYNLLNLPREASNANMGQSITYEYLADGTKVSALTGVGDGLKYRGSFVFEVVADEVDSSLYEFPSSVAWDEGRIVYANPFFTGVDSLAFDVMQAPRVSFLKGKSMKRRLPSRGTNGVVIEPIDTVAGGEDYIIGDIMDEWYVTDHLGSTRAIVQLNMEGNGSGSDAVLESNSYLPFGTRIPSLLNDNSTRHRFGGKEEQRFGLDGMTPGTDRVNLNLLDFGARYYDPYTCRWTSPDPLAEKYPGLSPYNYCAGDPIDIIDVNGKEGVMQIDENGNIIITSNIVVLLESQMAIPESASEKDVIKINRRNQRIARRNEDRLAAIVDYVSSEFSNAYTSDGKQVSFVFNITSENVSNPSKTTMREAIDIAVKNGIPNVETPDRVVDGQSGKGIALAAVIGQGSSGGALGSTQGNVLIQANDFSASTIAHELGHTFGLLDNYPNNRGGLMDYPAGALSPKDVDLIIKYAYVKKK